MNRLADRVEAYRTMSKRVRAVFGRGAERAKFSESLRETSNANLDKDWKGGEIGRSRP